MAAIAVVAGVNAFTVGALPFAWTAALLWTTCNFRGGFLLATADFDPLRSTHLGNIHGLPHRQRHGSLDVHHISGTAGCSYHRHR